MTGTPGGFSLGGALRRVRRAADMSQRGMAEAAGVSKSALSEEAWWHGPERYSRREPWYTFDRSRERRDRYRGLDGTPDDHQLPRPGDSPAERRAARNRDIRLRRAEERERARGGKPEVVPPWVCDCPPLCGELEDWHGPPRHADGCTCRCDPC